MKKSGSAKNVIRNMPGPDESGPGILHSLFEIETKRQRRFVFRICGTEHLVDRCSLKLNWPALTRLETTSSGLLN